MADVTKRLDPIIADSFPNKESLAFDSYDVYQDGLDNTFDENPSPTSGLTNPANITRAAQRQHFALGEDSPGKEELEHDLYTKNDKVRRNELLEKEKAKNLAIRSGLVNNYIMNADKPTVEELKTLTTKFDERADDLTADPNTYYEKKYGANVVTAVAFGSYEKALAEAPETTDILLKQAQTHVARNEVIRGIVDEYTEKYGDLSTSETIAAFAGLMTPGLSWYNTQNRIGQDHIPSSFLQGSNRQEQKRYLQSLPPEEAAFALRRAMQEIEQINPLDALLFGQDMLSYGSDWEALDNAFSFLEVADIPLTVGAARGARALKGLLNKPNAGNVGKKASATQEFTNRLERTIKAATDWQPDELFIMDAAGQVDNAALKGAAKMAQDRAGGVAPASSFEEISHYLSSFMNPKEILQGVSNKFSREASLRLVDTLADSASDLVNKVFNDTVTLNRLADDAVDIAVKEVEFKFARQYPTASGAIQDVEVLHDSITNTLMAELRLGLPTGKGFSSEEMAEFFAKDMWELGNYRVAQHADNWYVYAQKPLDETSGSVRNVLDIVTQNRTPGAFTNRWIGWLRGNKTKVSKDTARGFDVAVQGEAALEKFAQESLSVITKLSKKSLERLETFAARDRDWVSVDKKTRGRYANTLEEFQQRWMDYNDGLVPTEQEALAYFKYKQLNDLHFAILNHGIYRSKVRKGIEQHSFDLPGIKMKKPQVEGKIILGLPYSESNTGVLVVGPGGPEILTLRSIRNNERLAELMGGTDYQIIHVTPSGRKTLQAFDSAASGIPDGSHFNYVVVKKVKSKPLQYQQVPYQAGGNVQTKDSLRIVQANIRRVVNQDGTFTHYYDGDTTVFTTSLAAKGQKFLDKLETVKKFASTNGIDNPKVASLLKKELPALTYREFIQMFGEKGPLNLNEPLYVVPTNSSAERTHNLSTKYDNFVSPKDDPHNLYNDLDLSYAMERGLSIRSVDDKGTVDNPLFVFEESEKISPINMLNNTLDHMISTKYTKDLAIKEAELWLAEFKDVIKTDKTLRELRANPVATLIDAEINYQVLDKQKAAAARSAQVALKEILRLKDPEQKIFETAMGNILDKLYNTRGIGGPRVVEALEPWTLGLAKLGSPTNALRYSAFIGHMGMFNPVQIFLQAQSWVHVASIEGPGRAIAASFAGQNMLRLGYMTDTAAIKLAAKRSLAFGWKEKEFLESYEGLRKTGFATIGKEAAYLTDTSTTQATLSGVSRALDKTAVLFRMGERFVRTTAWNSAYMSWRKANPTAAFDDEAIASVLSRADTLSVNMTRSSNAQWQQGVASIPSQFLSFQARLTDQMLDFGPNAQLTAKEKAQLMLGYSLAYGVPAGALGSSIGLFWPAHEEINSYLRDNGYETDANVVARVLDKGVQQTFAYYTTGQELAISDRFAPGMDIVKEIYNGDKDFLEILAGPGGSFWARTAQKAMPLASTLGTIGTENHPSWKMITADLVELSTSVSTFSAAAKSLFAYNTHRILSTQGGEPQDTEVNDLEAAFLALGIQPQRVVDRWLILEDNKEFQKAQREITTEAKRLMRVGHQTLNEDDKLKFYRRANTLLQGANVDWSTRSRVITDSFKGHETFLEKAEKQMMERYANNPDAFNAWINKLERRAQ